MVPFLQHVALKMPRNLSLDSLSSHCGKRERDVSPIGMSFPGVALQDFYRCCASRTGNQFNTSAEHDRPKEELCQAGW